MALADPKSISANVLAVFDKVIGEDDATVAGLEEDVPGQDCEEVVLRELLLG
jgi:hypothetical protein